MFRSNWETDRLVTDSYWRLCFCSLTVCQYNVTQEDWRSMFCPTRSHLANHFMPEFQILSNIAQVLLSWIYVNPASPCTGFCTFWDWLRNLFQSNHLNTWSWLVSLLQCDNLITMESHTGHAYTVKKNIAASFKCEKEILFWIKWIKVMQVKR